MTSDGEAATLTCCVNSSRREQKISRKGAEPAKWMEVRFWRAHHGASQVERPRFRALLLRHHLITSSPHHSRA